MTTVADLVPSPEGMRSALESVGYLADEGIATALFCAARLPQPLLLEGEAGVGKTEAAKALADVLETPLIRLQCYEGIDAAEALYEWNFPRQLLAIKVSEAGGRTLSEDDLFGPEYLIARPLLRAVEHRGPRPAVLLIDEIDRADDEFEAFLFELLGEATVTIPELGTVRSSHPPIAVLTSNRTRDLHDALKRRCLYHWIDYPDVQRTTAIIRARVPAASQTLAAQVAAAVQRLRSLDVQKLPGVAEAINWVL
ncbi:MAG TPA: MoxR family ATPase, partial [Acidimicrobiales bacterium]|nr:MoxR family ATPase [Acidimicrobiales bacterium]